MRATTPSVRQKRLAATIEAMVSPLRHATPGDWVREAMDRFSALMETPTAILASSLLSDRATVSNDATLEEQMSSWSLWERGKLRFVEREMDENLSVIRPPASTNVFTSAIVDTMIDGAYSRSAFYREVLVPARARITYGMRVARGDGEHLLGACTSRPRFDPVGLETLGLLGIVAPAFEAGLEAMARLRDSQASLVALADARAEGVLIFDLASRRELHRNAIAADALTAEPEAAAITTAAARVVRTLATLAGTQRHPAAAGALPVSVKVRTTRAAYRLYGSLLAPGMFAPAATAMVFLQSSIVALPSEAVLRERFRLTTREAEIALRIARGASDREIGDALGLSAHTVGHHAENLFLKLGIHSRRALGVRLIDLMHEGPQG